VQKFVEITREKGEEEEVTKFCVMKLP